MRVLVEVVNKPLSLRGPWYRVGERLVLDSAIPIQAAVLAHDHATPSDLAWVRRVEAPTLAVSSPTAPELPPAAPIVAEYAVAGLEGPPRDKMVKARRVKRK